MSGRATPAWLAAWVFTLALVAVVVLHITGHGDGVADVVGLAGPVVAAVFVVQQVNNQLSAADAKLDQITAQTNGVLDQRIVDGSMKALEDAGLVDPGRHASV